MKDPAGETLAWVADFVVKLGLCPFAARPLSEGSVAVGVIPEKDVEEVFYAAGTRVQGFVSGGAETELLVFTGILGEFEEFLGFVGAIEDFLAETGADEFIQLAHFHPDYVFEGVADDDAGNLTNRSPYPTIQLLRVESVARAVAAYPDINKIPERNIALLQRLRTSRSD